MKINLMLTYISFRLGLIFVLKKNSLFFTSIIIEPLTVRANVVAH